LLSKDMSDEANLKRVNLRLSADDLTWLTANAEDEGVDYTTLIRMIINRLRRGRPPLVSMMAPRIIVPADIMAEQQELTARQVTYVPDGSTAEDVLQARLTELEGGDVVQLHAESPSETEAVATPLRRLARQQYNPGRR
jgi:hypothetical protein